mmetsp:Transcript_18956/g.75586  ORF Transcript_18956/g.75586 Transcript_18956/m.75586 type:complete len:408 (+) Transcript_18956:993-2216(+)
MELQGREGRGVCARSIRGLGHSVRRLVARHRAHRREAILHVGRRAVPAAAGDASELIEDGPQDGHHRRPAHQTRSKLRRPRRSDEAPPLHQGGAGLDQGLRRLVLARVVELPRLHVADGPRVVGRPVRPRQVRRLDGRFVHVERHERAVGVQRARSDHAQDRRVPRRRRAPRVAQPVRRLLPPRDRGGSRATRSSDAARQSSGDCAAARDDAASRTTRRPPPVRADAVVFRGLAAVGGRVDGRQRRALGPPRDRGAHAALAVDVRLLVRRRRRGRLLRRPRARAHGALDRGGGVHAVLPRPRAPRRQAPRAVVLRRAVDAAVAGRHRRPLRASAVLVLDLRESTVRGRPGHAAALGRLPRRPGVPRDRRRLARRRRPPRQARRRAGRRRGRRLLPRGLLVGRRAAFK